MSEEKHQNEIEDYRKTIRQLREALQNTVTIANNVENSNDLNDGGFFEAGFIAAKTKIVDALIKGLPTDYGQGAGT